MLSTQLLDAGMAVLEACDGEQRKSFTIKGPDGCAGISISFLGMTQSNM